MAMQSAVAAAQSGPGDDPDKEPIYNKTILNFAVSKLGKVVGDGTQLKIDERVWNDRNQAEQPLNMVLDFTDDVEERLNSPGYLGGERLN